MTMRNQNIFGTDGIRGTVNTVAMNANLALHLGIAIGHYFKSRMQSSIYASKGSNIVYAVVAKDTRLSGYTIESALTAGFVSVGVDITLVGPMPTASVPMLIHSFRKDFGIMITASHNPYHDNGLKIFDSYGVKIDSVAQKSIEKIVFQNLSSSTSFHSMLALPHELGKVKRLEDSAGRYIEYVKGVYSRERRLSGLKIVVDCANGAAYKIVPKILWELGAEVVEINCSPNGKNINANCGAIFPGDLAAKVVEIDADIGIALDGDADRLVICDEGGRVVNGDYVIALIARSMYEKGELKGGGVVITSASNTGLVEYLESLNIPVYISEVGDSKVYKMMQEKNCYLGAEQSGHIILGDYTTTGDGSISALKVLDVMVGEKLKASELFDLFILYPQVHESIAFHEGCNPLDSREIQLKLSEIQKDYSHMKIKVRKSGTENFIRLMVEGSNIGEVESIKKKIVSLLSFYEG